MAVQETGETPGQSHDPAHGPATDQAVDKATDPATDTTPGKAPRKAVPVILVLAPVLLVVAFLAAVSIGPVTTPSPRSRPPTSSARSGCPASSSLAWSAPDSPPPAP